MEFSVTCGTISINQTVFEGSAEQPVDLDVNLPDYCPDISRILKLRVTPGITSRRISGDRLSIDGHTVITLLYVGDSEQQICCYEQSIPLSASLTLKSEVSAPVILTDTTIDYINCRASSPRRISVHGAFNINVRVHAGMPCSVVSSAQGCGIQLKQVSEPFSSLIGAADRTFILSETFELMQSKANAEMLLRSGVSANISDYKAIANKIIVKGDGVVDLLYQCENGTVQKMSYTVPFSQIIDIPDLREDFICDIRCSVLNSDVQIRPDSSGENRLFAVEMRIGIQAFAYLQCDTPVVVDAFSTQCEIKSEYQELHARKVAGLLNISETADETITAPGELDSVCDVWCENTRSTLLPDRQRLKTRIQTVICVLAFDTQGTPVYFEREVEWIHENPFEGGCEELICDTIAEIQAVEYRLAAGGKLDLRIGYHVGGCLFAPIVSRVISELQPIGDCPIQRPCECALTLYFADAGEEIWDIARTYCTDAQAILTENELTDPIVEKSCMLLIPIL